MSLRETFGLTGLLPGRHMDGEESRSMSHFSTGLKDGKGGEGLMRLAGFECWWTVDVTRPLADLLRLGVSFYF